MRTRSIAAALAALTAVAAVPALAADPESGSISTAAPKVTWGGDTTAGFGTTFGQIFLHLAGQEQPCQSPSCDEFALDVKDAGDITFSVTAETSTISYLQVIKPDGSSVFADGLDPEGQPDNATVIKIKKAPAGAYKVQTAQNNLTVDTYTAFAMLGGATAPSQQTQPGPPNPPSPTDPPPASTTPPPSSQPQPATLSIKAGKPSARKLRRARRLAVRVSTTEPVTDVRVVLARGGKAVGKGALARLDKAATIKLKVGRKIKPGKYSLTVAAKQGARSVGARIKLRIRR